MSYETSNTIRGAGIITCLFLCSLPAAGQEWRFDPPTQQAYDLVLDLQTEEARQLIPEPKTAQETYVVSLAEAMELLITEDGEKYDGYERAYEERLGRRSKSSLADDLFLQAEMRLQWAFVHLKFGHEFDAAWNLRQAYLNVQDCKKKFPGFRAINKTSGLLQILIGSMPEKYNWVLNIMGMEGTIANGMQELNDLRQTRHALSFETEILCSLIQAFIFQETGAAMESIEKQLAYYPDNRLLNFTGASVAIKNAQSEKALAMLLNLEKHHEGLRLAYAFYLKGEVYLHKADYVNAVVAYRWFINNHRGHNNIKDAWYKIGLCYWLNGNANDAHYAFKEARNKGREASEADKYAARSLAGDELPNIPLSKARYFTDGGYYREAQQVLDSIRSPDIPNKRDHVEYYYRKARLAHGLGHLEEAKKFYVETINYIPGETPWYYAPNACLQMGYIMLDEKNIPAARSYFERAREYQKHEYKNSIDSKARSALAQLNERR